MEPLRAIRNRAGETVYRGHDTEQVCENGHSITRFAESDSRYKKDFCPTCGAKTITACPHCDTKIPGHLHGSYPSIHDDPPPSFCESCGSPYPWIENKVRAAKELIAESENLKPEERELMSKSVDDLVRDTPGTHVAAIRFKKFLPRVGRDIAEALHKFCVDVASETAKKALFPG